MVTSSSRTSTAGYVSLLEIVSIRSASQRTVFAEWCAPGFTRISPRYEVLPPPRAIDLETIEDEVYGAR